MAHPITNLGDLLHDRAIVHGDRPAVVGESALSFTALDQAASAWASAFNGAGLRPGAHIALLAGNGPQWLAAAFGVWRAGATLVPISTFVTARELAETLEHADIDALVLQPRLRSHDYLNLFRQISRPPRLRQVIVLDETAALRERAAGLAPTVVEPDSVACILYTSGTTGTPKGVMLSHRAVLSTVAATQARSGLTPSDSLLSTLPLFWVAGLVIRALPTLASGCALVLVETFTVEGLLQALQDHRPTALHLRPPQVGQLLAHPDFRPAMLAPVRRGGGRVEWYAPHLHREASFITGYGMTETVGYVTALDWRDPPEVRRDQLGAPLPDVELRITDGEVRVRGPGMFSGYYKQPAGTGLDEDGFFMTGDLGRIDARGTFHFVGRSKDLLRVKGINVSPAEVEGVLGTHPGVEAAYVVGLPADGLEQRVVALIVRRAEVALAESELATLSARSLSHYKRPEAYVFIERREVPLSNTSKPQRAALAEVAEARLRGTSC